MEEKEKNSILDLVENFFKEYRDKLTEKSPVFNKLIELDGGVGKYQDESFYCFNMQNLEEVRKHLKEIETNIFVTHDFNDKNFAFTDILSGIVSVNVHNISQFKLFNFPLDKQIPEDKKEIGETLASKIIYYLLHEINGHKKFAYEKNQYFDSPTKFIENGEIYTLCTKQSYLKGKNLIKIVPEDRIGEDGYFYELSYGKIGDYYTFEIMDNVDDFSDLLREVDLWVNKLDKLREYILYKFALQNYGANFKSKKSTIEEKIRDYKNECLKLQKNKHINMNTFFIKDKVKKKNEKKAQYFFNPTAKNINKEKEKYDSTNEFNSSQKIIDYEESELNAENEEKKEQSESKIEQIPINIKISKINNQKEEAKKEEDKEKVEEEEEEDDDDDDDEEEEANEEEIEEKEFEEEEDNINLKKIKKQFMQIPYETLKMIEESGVLTNEQTYIMRKRRRTPLRTVRYAAIIEKNNI